MTSIPFSLATPQLGQLKPNQSQGGYGIGLLSGILMSGLLVSSGLVSSRMAAEMGMGMGVKSRGKSVPTYQVGIKGK
jgi:hypothetical protein